MKFILNILKKEVVIILCLIVVTVIMYIAYANYDRDLLVEKDLLTNPPAKRCADCHKEIFNQWKNSRHAVSWSSGKFKKESENYSKQKCMGCHYPLKVSFESKPTQRKHHPEDGVSCQACHFIDNKMHGPYELNYPYMYFLFAPPHPLQLNRIYVQSGFCNGCHDTTYKEWQTSGSIKSCQECHMKTKKEHMMDRFPFTLLHYKFEVGDHSWPELKINDQDIDFEVTKEKEDLRVELENINIPHDMPTSHNAEMKIILKIRFISKDNTDIEMEKEIFSPQLETALKYKKKWSEIYSIPPDCAEVKVSLYLQKPWKNIKEELFTKKLKL